MPKPTPSDQLFADRLLGWFAIHGRHDLPWQQNPTPYRVWVSEIMLQQTQVRTVIPYYVRFMARFPGVAALARADIDQVLHLWTGLGYYARARNLHKAARTVVETYQGRLPESVDELTNLAGIGRSTAGAIAALGMGIRAPILDGNVKRVLTRYHAIAGYPEESRIKQQLWTLAESLTPHKGFAEYTQAIMDLGASLCSRSNPRCPDCPLREGCQAYLENSVTRYPGKKPKRALPVKAVSMFVLQNRDGEVLLEKRPASGIWGSLYSLPESEDPDSVTVINQIRLAGGKRVTLATIRHTFSHYHLDITPIRVIVDAPGDSVTESNRWLWYPLDHSLEVGLAAPVKKLLTSLTAPGTQAAGYPLSRNEE